MLRSFYKPILIVLLLSTSLGFMMARPEKANATLVISEGSATVHQQETVLLFFSKPVERQLAAGDALGVRQGDRIVMGANATAQLRLVNGTTVDVAQGTEMVLTTLDVGEKHQRVSLNVLAGSVYSRVQKLIGQDKFDITTPSSTASVRGTQFLVEIDDDNSTYYAVDEGRVHITMDQAAVDVNPEQEVLAIRGEALQVRPQSDRSAPDLFILSPTAQPRVGTNTVVRGRSEPGAVVTVNGITATVDAAGNFEVQVVAGSTPIVVTATDVSGNRVSVEIETEQ
jgi:hypothetical protein